MSAITFLGQFIRHPTRLGSIVPSSRVLSRRVVDVASVEPGQVVVELGAGTGPVTRQLVREAPEADLVAFEPTAALADAMQAALPQVDVVRDFAGRDLRQVLMDRGHHEADRVVSGLPWTMWPRAQQIEVLSGIVDALGPDGRFLTYTYVSSQARPAGARFRSVLREAFEDVWQTGVIWRNMPPAVVMVGDRPRKGAFSMAPAASRGDQPQEESRPEA